MLVPKLLLTPIKIRIFGPKTAKFGPKYAYLVILGQILPFLAHFVQCPTKKQCEQGAQVGFPYVGDKTFDFSSKNQDFLPKKVQIWPENGIFVHFGPGLAGSFGWWLWCAGCISQDTYLLYDISLHDRNLSMLTHFHVQYSPIQINIESELEFHYLNWTLKFKLLGEEWLKKEK